MLKIKRELAKIKWFYKIWRKFSVRKKNEGVVVLLSTPIHGNLGDQAIVCAEKKLISNFFKGKPIVEIPNNYYLAYPEIVKFFVRNTDIIIIDGGGNLGTLWKHEDDKIRSIIKLFSRNTILIFPQTCYYDNCDNEKERIEKNRAVYEEALDLTVMLRDRTSYELFNELFPNTKSLFVPDIVLSLRPDLKTKERKGVLLCFREDCEKNIDADSKSNLINLLNSCEYREFSTLVPYGVNEVNRFAELQAKWEELAGAELLICDRLHAMIFALITETPCIALDNVSRKVSGTYEWIQDVPYIRVVNSVDEIPKVMAELNVDKKYKNNYKYPYELLNEIRR